MSLPISVQLAQTLASAARTLNLADNVQITPSVASGHIIDLKV